MNAVEISRAYLRNTPLTLTRDLLLELTRYHRIQGSSGLESAIKFVKEVVEGLGYNTRLFEIPASGYRGHMDIPISWDVEDGYLSIKIGGKLVEEFRLSDHPTLVAAHSPPGEGCGKLVLCQDLHCRSGDVVLTPLPAYIAYKHIDAKLILVYDPKRYKDAVPYTGLFLHENEVADKVVMNIPYTTALNVMSHLIQNPAEEVEVCWKVKSSFSRRPLHGLIAWGHEEPEILYISHICHPRPGAHDNASGSVANLLVAYNAATSQYRIRSAHVWIPEYTGTVFLRDYVKEPRAVINLDMVGSKQEVTDSTLNIVLPPAFMKGEVAGYAYLAVKSSMDTASSFGGFSLPGTRYSVSPYTSGSDHDVTLSWGWPSTMLNEWPSKYYHTDMDDISTLSFRNIMRTAAAASTAGYLIQEKVASESLSKGFYDFLKSWYAMEAAKTGYPLSELEILSKSLWALEGVVPLETPLSSKKILRLIGAAKYMELRRITGALSFLMLYAPLAQVNGVKDYARLFQAENLIKWGPREEKVISEAWELIKEGIGL